MHQDFTTYAWRGVGSPLIEPTDNYVAFRKPLRLPRMPFQLQDDS